MSIADDIRAALRDAPGPLTAKEVREALDDDFTAEQVGNALLYMVKTGECIRDGEGHGKFTYVIDSNYQPKRGAADAATVAVASPPPALKPVKPKPAANKNGAAPARLNPIVGTQTITAAHVALPLADLRLITAALIERHPGPMSAALRDAVIGAMKATL